MTSTTDTTRAELRIAHLLALAGAHTIQAHAPASAGALLTYFEGAIMTTAHIPATCIGSLRRHAEALSQQAQALRQQADHLAAEAHAMEQSADALSTEIMHEVGADAIPTIVQLWASGGHSWVSDYLMSDGTVETLTQDEAAKRRTITA